LDIVAVAAQCVSAVEGILIALEGHGGFAVVVVGTAQKVVSQETVVRCAVVVEEIDIGLYVGSGEGLVVVVALVDAVQLSAHTVAVRLCGTAGERQENGYDGQQMLHLPAKIQKIPDKHNVYREKFNLIVFLQRYYFA
jgi:hypothetical protein